MGTDPILSLESVLFGGYSVPNTLCLVDEVCKDGTFAEVQGATFGPQRRILGRRKTDPYTLRKTDSRLKSKACQF